MHVSRGAFLKTCGLALAARSLDTPLLRAAASATAPAAVDGSDVFLGQILTVPFNFAPEGFAFCDGQLLSIAQNPALFSLLGTMYGGDGKTTFALPNLQGAVPVGVGQGPGLSPREQGEVGGSETVTLLTSEIAPHTHVVSTTALTAQARCRNGPGTSAAPAGSVPAAVGAAIAPVYGDGPADVSGHTGSFVVAGSATAVGAGGGAPHGNVAPSLVLNYVIALQGIYPSRS